MTTSARRQMAIAVGGLAGGGGLALLAAARPWHTVTARRRPPLSPVVAEVAGRTVAPAVAGLAVVALAGVVAVLATRGFPRRLVGAALVVTGAGLAWQTVAGARAPGPSRARELLGSSRSGVVFEAGQRVQVTGHPGWAVLAGAGAALVGLGGLIVAWYGARWPALSARYEAPVAPRSETVNATGSGAGQGNQDHRDDRPSDLALWQSLERGQDPTAESRINDPDPAHPDPGPPGPRPPRPGPPGHSETVRGR